MNMEVERLPMEQLMPLLQLQMEQGGSAWLTVTGSSMHPTFRHGRDRVELVQRPPCKGDVALYRRENGVYVLHRILGAREENWLCAGDNQWETEEVSPSQVIACVQRFFRKGKTHPVTQAGYRLWTGLWIWLLPVRKPILKLRRLWSKIKHRWRKRK